MCPRDMPFTSESVTEGHPDKLCDQIFDAVLDECLRLDPDSRVACDLLQISYCIGLADPVSVMANTFGSATLADVALVQPVRKLFPLSPRGTIDHLDLKRPIHRRTAAYGHFGREEFPWERLDAVDELKAKAKRA